MKINLTHSPLYTCDFPAHLGSHASRLRPRFTVELLRFFLTLSSLLEGSRRLQVDDAG